MQICFMFVNILLFSFQFTHICAVYVLFLIFFFFFLQDAGQPLQKAWAELSAVGRSDPVVRAALATVPAAVVSQGAAPVTHLKARFSAVESAARKAAYISPASSFTSHVLASVFGAVTLKESDLVTVPASVAVPADSNPAAAYTTEIPRDHARLSRATYFVQRGELAQAVGELEAIGGLHSRKACDGFIAEAKERLVLDQAVAVLRAHAFALGKDIANARE